MNKRIFNFIAIALLTLVSLSACGPTTEENPVDPKEVLEKSWNGFVAKNLEEAKEYADKLVEHATDLCAPPSGTSQGCSYGRQPASHSAEDCVKHDWVELNEYATKRNKIFLKIPGMDDLKDGYTALNNKAGMTGITLGSATFAANTNAGLMPLQQVIFGTDAFGSSHKTNSCAFLQASAADIKLKVTALKTAWEGKKATFLNEQNPKEGIKNVLTSISEVMKNTNKEDLKDVIDSSGTFEGETSGRSAWLIDQVAGKPKNLFNGDYKDKWTVTIEKYLQSVAADKYTAITTAYGSYKTSLEKFYKREGGAPNQLTKQALTTQTVKDDALKLSTDIDSVADAIKAAADAIK